MFQGQHVTDIGGSRFCQARAMAEDLERPLFGPFPTWVDPAAAQARAELQRCLNMSFPKAASANQSLVEEKTDGAAAGFSDGHVAEDTDGIPPEASAVQELHAAAMAAVAAEKNAKQSMAGPSSVGPTIDERAKKEEQMQAGLDKLKYLSQQSGEMRVAWTIEKASKLHKEGNALFQQGEVKAASSKYRSALDIIGQRDSCPAAAQRTHDDLTVMCASNLAACALKIGHADDALRLCDQVLAIDATHDKAKFRRAAAVIRRRSQESNVSANDPTYDADDDHGPRWAAARGLRGDLQVVQVPPSAAPAAATGEAASRHCQRAVELLEVQDFLEALCRKKPKDRAVRELVEELYSTAKVEGVHLRPPTWLLPRGLRSFEYFHCTSEADDSEAHSGGSSSSAARVSSQPCGPGRERNLMVLLHGFGGRKDSFVDLVKSMKLPKTACLIFDGVSELEPDLLDDPPGFCWFDLLDDEYQFIKPSKSEKRRLASLEASGKLLTDALLTLCDTLAWSLNEMFIFGYGHGGTLGLDLLLRPPTLGLGGVVGIGTEVLPERLLRKSSKSSKNRSEPRDQDDTPAVLLIHGDRDTITPVSVAEATAAFLNEELGPGCARLEVFPGRGGEMLRGAHKQEMQVFMEFLSDHLQGVGKRGSAEAMERLAQQTDVEEVASITLCELD
eukprot:TRINITY_DN12847_c0_g8_i1.p1 TRINITY_DN12847_c0_g8~~TRINITY_DN12847_c0_g8_i1.p1  ORF type:complete len:673 (-),score=171.79 TRINITY_DN12847_c0_g8_i1:56-2074(-)